MSGQEWHLKRARRSAATRLGITLDDYEAHIGAGEKWCTGCRLWHPRTAFGANRAESDGLQGRCKAYRVWVRNSLDREDWNYRLARVLVK